MATQSNPYRPGAAITAPVGFGQAMLAKLETHQQSLAIALVVAVGVLIAIYQNMFAVVSDYWQEATYSHGWLIPLMAMVLMWVMRNPNRPVDTAAENNLMLQVAAPLGAALAAYFLGSEMVAWWLYSAAMLYALWIVLSHHDFEVSQAWERWLGVPILAIALTARIGAALYDSKPFDRLSFLLAVPAVFLMVGGWPLLKRMAAGLGFFIFMYPLPTAVETGMLGFLQKLAAFASTIALQILGVPAIRDGNKISIDGLNEQLFVEEACSGLRMLTIFLAMSIFITVVVNRPWWDKLVLLVAALPIALATNIIRIIATALLFMVVEGSTYEKSLHQIIHDWAGLAMIVVALSFMFGLLKLLQFLTVAEEAVQVRPVGALRPRA